jgi:fluoroacetyl-CoA thioesterase
VEILAEPSPIVGRLLTFQVKAVGESGEVVACGEIDRVIVDRQKFLGR